IEPALSAQNGLICRLLTQQYRSSHAGSGRFASPLKGLSDFRRNSWPELREQGVGGCMGRVWVAFVLTVVFAAAVALLGLGPGGSAAPTSNLGMSKAQETIKYYDV